MNVNAGDMNGVGVQLTGRDDFFHLHDADFSAGCGRVIEISCGLPEYGIACCVRFPGFHNCEVGDYAVLEDMGFAIKILMLLALCDQGADAGSCIKSGYAGAAGPHPFG